MNVDLGTKHRQKLGKMLLSAAPGMWQDYAVYLERLHQPGKDYLNSALPAKKGKDDNGRNGYCFFMAGYRVYFLCDSRGDKMSKQNWHINETGYTEIPLRPFQGTKEEEALFACRDAEHNRNDQRLGTISTP